MRKEPALDDFFKPNLAALADLDLQVQERPMKIREDVRMIGIVNENVPNPALIFIFSFTPETTCKNIEELCSEVEMKSEIRIILEKFRELTNYNKLLIFDGDCSSISELTQSENYSEFLLELSSMNVPVNVENNKMHCSGKLLRSTSSQSPIVNKVILEQGFSASRQDRLSLFTNEQLSGKAGLIFCGWHAESDAAEASSLECFTVWMDERMSQLARLWKTSNTELSPRIVTAKTTMENMIKTNLLLSDTHFVKECASERAQQGSILNALEKILPTLTRRKTVTQSLLLNEENPLLSEDFRGYESRLDSLAEMINEADHFWVENYELSIKSQASLSCEERQEQISSLIDGELETDAENELTNHLTECVHCRSDLRAMRKLDDDLRKLSNCAERVKAPKGLDITIIQKLKEKGLINRYRTGKIPSREFTHFESLETNSLPSNFSLVEFQGPLNTHATLADTQQILSTPKIFNR